MSGVEWRPCVGFPDYAVTNDGRVRRLTVDRRGNAYHAGRELAPHREERGYVSITLYRDGRAYGTKVHILVLRAFGPPQPTPKHQAAHNDGDTYHNHISNLRWATPTENHADKRRHGTVTAGEKNSQAILDAEKVQRIRMLVAGGLSQRAAGDLFGVSRGCICDIVRRTNWAHVP